MLGLILSTFLFVTPAMGEKFELAVTSSFQTVRDPRWEKISATAAHSATGMTMGYSVSDTTSILVGFQTGRTGSRLLIPTDDGFEDEDFGFNIASTLNHYQLGARYRWNWKPRWVPTTTVALQLGHAILRMDENVDVEGGEVTNRYSAVAVGFEFGGGIEYTVAYLNKDTVRINLGLETGFTKLFDLRFKDEESGPKPITLGELDMSGIFFKLSLGTRF